MARPWTPAILVLLSLSANTGHVAAYFGISDMPLYSSADKCAQSCAVSAYDYYWVDFSCQRPNIPACLCDVPSHRSASLDLGLSICAARAPCLSTDIAGVSAIFSQFCDAQGYGANHVPASVLSAATATPILASQTGTASTGAAPFSPQSTSASTGDSSSGSFSGGLSHSDKIAIICASIGAVATLVAGYFGQRKWRKHHNQNVAASSSNNQDQRQDQYKPPPFYPPEHGQPQMVRDPGYYDHNRENFKFSPSGSVELGGRNVGEPGSVELGGRNLGGFGTDGGRHPAMHEMDASREYRRN